MKSTTVIAVAVSAMGVAGAVAYGLFFQNRGDLPAGFVQGNGRIKAEQVEVAPTLAGRVVRALAAEGNLVMTGDVLVEIDTDELSAALDRANAEVALAR